MTSIAFACLTLIFVVFLIGSLSALFLLLMSAAEFWFLSFPLLVWGLPFLGLLTGWAYSRFGRDWPGTPTLLGKTHEADFRIPQMTGPSIFLFTILSQLFGASTGRESTAIQMGAAISNALFERVSRFLRKDRGSHQIFSRELFLRCGLAAGFGAVFGVPWAGALFSLEATRARRWPFRLLPWVLFSSFTAHWVALAWGASHKVYDPLPQLPANPELIFQWIVLGCAFGAVAFIFAFLVRAIERGSAYASRSFQKPCYAVAVGGALVAVLTSFVFQSPRYNGMGLPLIEAAFNGNAQTFDFILKAVMTALSVGVGFKGGDVTPLMAVGATLGASVAGLLKLPLAYSVSLGLIAVFASSMMIPWTGAIMAWELFGFEAFLPAFVICFIGRKIVLLRK